MCGIMGVLNSDKIKDPDLSKYMQDGLIAGAVRGQDATGLFQVKAPTKASDVVTYKTAEFGNEFVRNARAQSLLSATPTSFLTIGHNRAATAGGTSRAAAHPFVFSVNTNKKEEDLSFVGVHNGTLTTWHAKEGEIKLVSDSEWALWQIASYGAEKVLPEFNGAFAFVFYDQRHPNVLNMFTNGDRPLHFAFVEQRDTILIASEPEMLYWLSRRNRLKLEKDTILSCANNVLYRFSTDDLRDYQRTTIIPKPKVIGTAPSSTYVTYSVENIIKKAVEDIMAEVRGTKKATSGDKPRVSAAEFAAKDPSVSSEEFMCLKVELQVPIGAESWFEPKVYDPITKIIHGEVSMAVPPEIVGGQSGFEVFDAQMRNVTSEENEAIQTENNYWECRALGAFFKPRTDVAGEIADPVIVLSKPVDLLMTISVN